MVVVDCMVCSGVGVIVFAGGVVVVVVVAVGCVGSRIVVFNCGSGPCDGAGLVVVDGVEVVVVVVVVVADDVVVVVGVEDAPFVGVGDLDVPKKN